MNADADWVGGQTYFHGLGMLGKVERGAGSELRADDFGLTRIVFIEGATRDLPLMLPGAWEATCHG